MSNRQTNSSDTAKPFVARTMREFSVPIIVGWLAIAAVVTFGVPSLEKVGQERSVPMTPTDAPSIQAMKRMGQLFKESDSDNLAMIVLEGERLLGDDAHHYYDNLIRSLRNDTTHVEHIQDFWGDPVTAAGVQSSDGKAAYVQLYLAGNEGEARAAESIDAVRNIVGGMPPPSGLKVYLTGPAVLMADMHSAGDKSVIKITATAVAMIFTMLILVYRSFVTVILLLAMVGLEFTIARGVVAFLGELGFIGLSTFSVTMLTSLAIAAGTDYGIFLLGRYQEARQAGEDPERAYYATYRGVVHVILGSGLTIAGATYCLSFTRLSYFRALGIPSAVGMLVAVVVAVTLGPAVLTVGSRFGLFDPKRMIRVRGWRRVGTVVVRWPAPVLAATCGVALVGLLTLPGYQANYNERQYIPGYIPANAGYVAAERHFSPARMKPDILLLEADHDMRNPADLLVLERLAKGAFRVPGIARVQSITRPQGNPIGHTSIPFIISMQNAGLMQNMKFERDRINDLLVQADEMAKSIALMKRTYELMEQLTELTHHMTGDTKEISDVTGQLRDGIADFDDFWRPIRNYFYWEVHCYDIPACWSLRSVFDTLDGVEQISEKLEDLLIDMDHMDALMPEMAAQLGPMIENMEAMRTMMLTMHSTMSGIFAQMDVMSSTATGMGKAFDTAKNDDSFYLPPAILKNSDFKRVLKLFLSPDGKAARLFISRRGDPTAPAGIASVDAIKTAAEEALKGTPLEDSKIYLGGSAAIYRDISEGARYDLLIAVIASGCLIFIVMLLMTRSFVAAVVIVGTVGLSLGASFGISVLLWQHIIQLKLHWLVLATSMIVLLAVGSDYNLLLVSRLKQEIGAGLNTGIIRAMGGTGKVVTNAGLVFAFTMAALLVSELRMLGQLGTTIGLGLLFDTLVVRAFMTPSVIALLGRWFWWPMTVRLRPAGPPPRRVERGPDERSLVVSD